MALVVQNTHLAPPPESFLRPVAEPPPAQVGDGVVRAGQVPPVLEARLLNEVAHHRPRNQARAYGSSLDLANNDTGRGAQAASAPGQTPSPIELPPDAPVGYDSNGRAVMPSLASGVLIDILA